MQTETTYTDVEVDITIGFDELEALIRDGEILAHPDNAPQYGIVYDQHPRAESVVESYIEEENAEPLLLSQRDLIEVLNGEDAEWDHEHPEENVILRYEADRIDGDLPAFGPEAF